MSGSPRSAKPTSTYRDLAGDKPRSSVTYPKLTPAQQREEFERKRKEERKRRQQAERERRAK